VKKAEEDSIQFVSEVQTIILGYQIASKTANKNARISLDFLAFFLEFIYQMLYLIRILD